MAEVNKKSLLVVVFVVTIQSCLLQAQTLGRFISVDFDLKKPFTIRQISNQDGLPQSEVFRILPLKDRSLALSTAFSPVIYNGYYIKRLLSPSQDEAFYNRLWHLPSLDQVYGISHRNGQLVQVYPTVKRIDIVSSPFCSLLPVGDSIILVGPKGKISVYDPKSSSSKRLYLADPDSAIRRCGNSSAMVMKGDTLFIAEYNGVFAYCFKSKKVVRITTNNYSLLDFNSNTNKIIAVNADVVVDLLDNEKVLYQVPTVNGKKLQVLSMCFALDDEIVVGTDKGLCFFYQDYVEIYDKTSGLPSHYIQSLYYDAEMLSLYVGTGENGLLKLQYKTNYSFSAAQNYLSAGSVVRLPNGKVVFVSGGNEIRQITADSSLTYINKGAVFSCLDVIDNKLWAGTWGKGLRIYDNQNFVDSVNGNKLHNLQVLALYKAKNGVIWIGSVNGVSSGTSAATVKKNTEFNIEGEVICFYELRDGSICIGTTEGAYVVKDNKLVFKHDRTSGFSGIEVRCFYEDPKGRIWMGTYGHGIFVIDNHKVTSLQMKQNCMLDRDAFCLAEDGMGYIYSTSNHGLWRIKKNSLFDFYEGKIDYLVPFYYGQEEGILNTEFNGGFQNNYCKSKWNHFYFPNIEGVVMTVPEELTEFKLTPRFEAITVNDTLVTLTQSEFDRNTHSIQFDFICSNLSSKHNIYFQYKLIGGESNRWSQPQKQTSVNLRMLPPGSYTFVVRAINGFNDPKPPETTYAFSIQPYFYETLWFKILVVFALIGLTVIAMLVRSRQQKNKVAEKERYARQMAQLELKAIQAQLNPHFVFNCLNTIKSLILQRDYEKANQGLNTFSSLTREMLENSDKIFIPFQQNLKFCKDYIELEKMRLQEEFNYTLQVDPTIADNPLLPHLLIQPYIENAIKHGIAHLENRKGYLEVEFKKINNGIVCRIRDNGIGRDASYKINAKRSFHVSKGTALTVEKSTFLRSYIGYDSQITVLDLFDNHGAAIGTEVTIFMPFTDESSSN